MYDKCFDGERDAIPRVDRGVLWTLRIIASALAILAGSADAQMPNSPVLQNVWSTPGIVGAFNLAGGSGGSVYAAAGSWAPGSGRFQLSGGLGVQAATGGGGSSMAYGLRVAMPMASATASFGYGAFVGIGGGSSGKKIASTASGTDTTTTSSMRIPVGVALGWRHGIGASHGFSLYATPAYVWLNGGGSSGGLVRVGLGADVGVTQSLGITGGMELGQTKSGAAGTTGTLYGLGVSYAFGRR
jgi:hypothetical protein